MCEKACFAEIKGFRLYPFCTNGKSIFFLIRQFHESNFKSPVLTQKISDPLQNELRGVFGGGGREARIPKYRRAYKMPASQSLKRMPHSGIFFLAFFCQEKGISRNFRGGGCGPFKSSQVLFPSWLSFSAQINGPEKTFF